MTYLLTISSLCSLPSEEGVCVSCACERWTVCECVLRKQSFQSPFYNCVCVCVCVCVCNVSAAVILLGVIGTHCTIKRVMIICDGM